MKAPPLITRTDLRLALTAGLSAGFVIVLGLPDPFYAPLAVGAAMGGTVGATRLLGTQRVLGTLLGGVIVAIGFNTMGQALPLPLGVAVALALTRIFGGSLGLRSGYKVAGLVVAMGWTVHHTNLASWIPTRLVVTLIGVLAAWLAVSQIWPSRALEQHQEHSSDCSARSPPCCVNEPDCCWRSGNWRPALVCSDPTSWLMPPSNSRTSARRPARSWARTAWEKGCSASGTCRSNGSAP